MAEDDKRSFRRRASDRRQRATDLEANAEFLEAKRNSRWALGAASAALAISLATLLVLAWGGG